LGGRKVKKKRDCFGGGGLGGDGEIGFINGC